MQPDIGLQRMHFEFLYAGCPEVVEAGWCAFSVTERLVGVEPGGMNGV